MDDLQDKRPRVQDAGPIESRVSGRSLQYCRGDPARNFAALRDDGLAPDDHANDGVYRGTAVWKYSFGLAQDEPVKVQMTWYDGYPGGELAGAPLTVEE